MSSAISTGSVLARTLSRKPASISITAAWRADAGAWFQPRRRARTARAQHRRAPHRSSAIQRARPVKHGNARRVDRVAFGMRNGKTGDKAGLGLVLASNKGSLYGRCVIGKTELDGLLGQIMQGVLARGGGIPDRHLVGRYKSHGNLPYNTDLTAASIPSASKPYSCSKSTAGPDSPYTSRTPTRRIGTGCCSASTEPRPRQDRR